MAKKRFRSSSNYVARADLVEKRILEVYLNIAEFGNGIFGVEAASRYYFKKSAKNLSQNEAALLVAVLPNPIIYK